jgi:hypothetical protein
VELIGFPPTLTLRRVVTVTCVSNLTNLSMSRGHIDRILIKDFKSYGGDHIIGPFKTFTSIIGMFTCPSLWFNCCMAPIIDV